MKHIPIRIGPLALLLAVITVCMATLGVLTLSTSMADRTLAQTYSETVASRYAREAEGQALLRDAAALLASGGDLSSLAEEQEDGSYLARIEDDSNSALVIRFTVENDAPVVQSWQTETQWVSDQEVSNIWSGLD